jgi:hypothetical protein
VQRLLLARPAGKSFQVLVNLFSGQGRHGDQWFIFDRSRFVCRRRRVC